MRILFVLQFILISQITIAQSTITGKLISQNGEPILGANVYLEGTYDGASSNIEGLFSFKTQETGNQKLVITFIGFEKQVLDITLPNDLDLEVKLKEEINRLDAVVISAGSFTGGEENNREVLKPLDIVTTAGATADIAGALNTLPGTQTVGETGRLFVRGGEGYETKTFIDGMEVMNSYSVSAPNTPGRSRFSPNMFKGTSFSTGGYSAEYGQALSSALILNSKDMPEANRTDLSLMSVGADVSHSQIFDNSSISGKIQYTNLEPYFQLVKQQINYQKAPESFDGNLAYRQKIGNEGMLKIYSNTSQSDLNISIPQILDETIEDKMDISNFYNHFNVSYRDILNEKWSVKTGAAVTNTRDDISLNNEAYKEKSNGTHVKTVLNYDASKATSISFGAEHYYTDNAFEIKEIGAPKFAYKQNLGAAFAEANYFISNDFVLRSGLRAEYNDLTNNLDVFPRASLAHKLGANGQVSFAYGRFNQTAQPQFLRVQNDILPEQAEHFILNYQIINDGQTFRIETYYKGYSDLLKFTNQYDPTTFTNSGSGYAKGIDVFWRDNKTVRGLDYWVSYSYIDTKRDYQNFPEKAVPSFSSAHNLSVVGKYFVRSIRTQIGATYSFSSARPFNNPNQLEFNSGRTPAYHDLSLNLSYLYKSNVIIHASVTNVLGLDNIFGYEYSDQPNSNGEYVGRAIMQQAPRFIFLGIFITLSKNDGLNLMPNL